MLTTKDLILDKAKFEDWEGMLRNVWTHPEAARYMRWELTTGAEEAQGRMLRTIEFQKTHDTYLVYLRESGEPIGFAGVEQLGPETWGETGICLGPGYVGRGYGKQILQCLMEYSKSLGAREFVYSTRERNQASKALARAFGFRYESAEDRVDERDGTAYRMERYRRVL